ncbi:uncharacterized protein BXIN_3069 [Babesia sp. Xinjiang]|uniref:uncharacterized protein n=1 Tax=Babesia sp. Xinjiang TaxID=462227 RepID=UPI000A24F0D6|nr:uncharacterized protein BXIN_3069 [Babesia sp. Xinjiang]ORM39357.1 hypothetical protein BXIN_3069 [Babesia sp. Xinjiang]
MDLGLFNLDSENTNPVDASETDLLGQIDILRDYTTTNVFASGPFLSPNALINLNDLKAFDRDVSSSSNSPNRTRSTDSHDDEKVDAKLESTKQRLVTPKIRRMYNFPLAARVKSNCLFKILLNHTVAGLYIGKNGNNLKRLQSKFNFKLTQSGRGVRGDFTGIGYPCHRTNTALLFEGNLVNILMALRPLYRIIQNDRLTLDKESQSIVSGRVLNVKFELDLVIPLDRKRLLMQEEGMRCNRLRRISGVGIIAGKQNYEWGNIKETIVTLYGFEENVERACEWMGVFLQDSPAVYSRDFAFIDYPKYTLAVPEGAFN